MSKCIIIKMLLIQVKPSDLKGLYKVTETHGREGKIATNVWFLRILNSITPSLILCSVYQTVFVVFIPNRVTFSCISLGQNRRQVSVITDRIFKFHQCPMLGCHMQIQGTWSKWKQVAAKQILMSQKKKNPTYGISASEKEDVVGQPRLDARQPPKSLHHTAP